MAPYFPLAGLVVGALVSASDLLARRLWTEPAAAVIDTVVLMAVTGAFHLDGLADTADGLFSHRSRRRALEIMKDSRVGVMGVAAVAAVLSLKGVGILGLSGAQRTLLLILVPAYARASVLFTMNRLPYGRPEGGLGRGFFDGPLGARSFLGTAAVAALSLALGWTALWLNLAFAVLVAAAIRFYRNRMGCVTGDMLGAMIEGVEAALFLLLSLRWVASP
jgi:adenosylcobinamide-GDP ribazoletransferase